MEFMTSSFKAMETSVLGETAKVRCDADLSLVDRVAVELPIKADLLAGAAVVWKFPIFVYLEGTPEPLRVTRSLEDAVWVRRALLAAIPGAYVPPGPLSEYASKPESTLSGRPPAIFASL